MNTIKTLKFTLKSLYKIDRINFWVVIILTTLSGIAPIITLQLTQIIFNMLQSGKKELSDLIVLVVAYVLFMVFVSILSNILSFFSNKLAVKISYVMTEQLMEACGRLSLEDLEDSKTYEKITRIENEIKNKPVEILESTLQMGASIILLCGTVIILLVWKPLLAIFFLFYSILQIFFNLKIAHQEFEMMYNRSERERKIWYYTFLLTHDTGFKEIKVLNLQNYFLKKYKILTDTFIKDEIDLSKKRMNLNTLLITVQEIFSGLVMFYAICESYKGNIMIGTTFTIISTLNIIYSTIRSISDHLYILYNSSLYMEQWKEFLGANRMQLQQDGIDIMHIYDISFSHVCYRYKEDERFNLEDINFSLKSGQRVAIVGKNGCGKSTILKLLVGLYQPKAGSIKVNGYDLNSINHKSYHKKISVLFQDFFKYENTVLENIAISDVEKEIDLNRVRDSLYIADFSLQNVNENLLDIQLGNWFSNGQQLSGGEWQKIALARTYYKKADMVVLDEPSSALDSSAENKIFRTFFDITKEKLGIYITHRVSIAKKADIIIVMDYGKIDCIGRHDVLLKKSKVYRELYELEKEN